MFPTLKELNPVYLGLYDHNPVGVAEEPIFKRAGKRNSPHTDASVSTGIANLYKELRWNKRAEDDDNKIVGRIAEDIE